jgi:hypothetical protein
MNELTPANACLIAALDALSDDATDLTLAATMTANAHLANDALVVADAVEAEWSSPGLPEPDRFRP